MPTVYRASIWRGLDVPLLTLLFGSLLGGSIWSIVVDGPRGPVVGFLPLWAAMFAIGLYLFLYWVRKVEIEPDAITYCAIARNLRVPDVDVMSYLGSMETEASLIGAGRVEERMATVALFSGKRIPIRFGLFHQGLELEETIKARYAEAHHRSVDWAIRGRHRFRARGFGWMIGALFGYMAVFMSVVAWLNLDRYGPALLMGVPMALVALWLGTSAGESYARVSPKGIETRRMGVRRELDWRDVTMARCLLFYAGRGSKKDSVILYSDEARITLNWIFDDYPLLRDVVLSQVPPDRFADERPRH